MWKVKNFVLIVIVTTFLSGFFIASFGKERLVEKHIQRNEFSFTQRKLLEPDKNIMAKQQTESSKEKLPTIFVITPTYKRLTQLADMTRLSNTLRNVKQLHWIVVEEGKYKSDTIENLLSNSGITYTYLHASKYKKVSPHLKGIHQRNAGLYWIRQNIDPDTIPGVFYFADDDNTYDLRLFEEMRYTKKVSVWPVGFTSVMQYQRPIVENGKITGFRSWNTEHRWFPVDMAAFALNIKVLFDIPHLYFLPTFYIGYQETQFLELCCTVEELEPKANNCSQILVWHTKTLQPDVSKTVESELEV